MILRTCDCCGKHIANDNTYYKIAFQKNYDNPRCDGAILQGMANCLNQPVITPDFCESCVEDIRECIKTMHKAHMGKNAKELNI